MLTAAAIQQRRQLVPFVQSCPREKMVSKEDKDRVIKLMGEYLLKGYTLLDGYCQECSNPIMKRRNEDPFCVYCRDVKQSDLKPIKVETDMETAPSVPVSAQLTPVVPTGNVSSVDLKNTLGSVIDISTSKLVWSTALLHESTDIEQCIKLTQLTQSIIDILERALKIKNSQ